MNVLIVIPAFNESKSIGKVIRSLPKNIRGAGKIEVLVVNDGSTDDTEKNALKTGVKVITHSINRGAGAATRTGMEYVREKGYDVLLTFDADGQHNPKDINNLLKPVLNGKADLVIGSRLKKRQRMPKDRLIINWIANIVTLALFGVFSTDSQSGLKAFSKKAIELIEITSDRMEFSSEILLEAKKNNLKIQEVPVSAIYTPYSITKGQKNSNAIPIFIRIMTHLLR
ncbi:glycosyltransferase family 2 protein [Candidatus Curtissbacteria bacterium]|nr:glycosyltransferase family 2 protein [Candidatus Curtissbacteria bacterium]